MATIRPYLVSISLASTLVLSACAGSGSKKAMDDGCGPQDSIPEADRLGNTPKWATASEENNFGFDVFRGDQEEGDFIKLNDDPILGAGTTDEPSYYQFKDSTIDPCKAYWYYVESISNSGVREKFTPTFRARPKVGPGSKAAEEAAKAANEEG